MAALSAGRSLAGPRRAVDALLDCCNAAKSACNVAGRPLYFGHVAVQQSCRKRSTRNPTSLEIMTMMTAEQVVAAHKANVETLFGLTNKAFEGVEKLVELNLQVAKAALAEAADTTPRPPCRSRTRKSCWPCKPACCSRPPRRPPPTAATCTTSPPPTSAEVGKVAEAQARRRAEEVPGRRRHRRQERPGRHRERRRRW